MWAFCWSSSHGRCFCRQAGRFPDRWSSLPTFAAFRSHPKREFFLRCSARSTLHTKRGFVGGYEASRSVTIGSSDRGCRLRWAKEGIDDWDKASSFDLAHPRRSTSSLGAMIDVRAVFDSITVFTLLAGCGPSADTPVPVPPPIAARSDVIVTFDGERHACVVALYSEAQGSAISCEDVVPFVRDELRLPSGSIYDIRTIPD